MRIIRILVALGAALSLAAAFAAAPKSVEVKVEPNGKYSVGAYRFGTAELVGYLGDRKEEAGIEAVVFKGVSAENEAALVKLTARAGLKPFASEDGKLRELTAEPAPGGTAAGEHQ